MSEWKDPEPFIEVASGERAAREGHRGHWLKVPREQWEYEHDEILRSEGGDTPWDKANLE